MGVKKTGKWTIEKDQLCLFLGETEDGCYEVRAKRRADRDDTGRARRIDRWNPSACMSRLMG
jgi:hypothetical protein